MHSPNGIATPRVTILDRLADPVVVALAALIYRDRADGRRRAKWIDWRYRALRENAASIGMRVCAERDCGEVIWPERHIATHCSAHIKAGG